MEIRFKQGYERTLKSVHTNVFLRIVWKLGSNKFIREQRSPFIQKGFREKCDFRFKRNYERTAKSVHTNLLSRNVWKLSSNKIMRERRSPFIQTCF